MSLLEIRNVSSGYGEVQILWGTTLALQEGKLTSLVGGNGVGKTTLLRSVMGSIKPWDGSVWFEGKDVSRLPPYQKAEMGLILVPEGRQLFTDMSVAENLEMGASPRRARATIKRNFERIYEMFPRLEEACGSKSGHAERRRAADARSWTRHHGRAQSLDDRRALAWSGSGAGASVV